MFNPVKDQLGISIGTARHKLVQSLLYSMACQLGSSVCFQCSELITCASTMSIEHKKPWLHNSPDLFWDLKNIAFSHKSCNRPSPERMKAAGLKARKVGPPGKSWCGSCKIFLPTERFYRGKRWDGLADSCKSCKNKNQNRRRIEKSRQRK